MTSLYETTASLTTPPSKGFVPRHKRNKSWSVDIGPADIDPIISIKAENQRLKASLTRVQNEYDELKEESNFQRAKVVELSDIVATASSSPKAPSTTESSVEHSLETISDLRDKLRESETKCQELMMQKRMNNKLLLEMGGIIRTLNMVDIDYDLSMPSNQKTKSSLSAQEISVKNIKSKVEAMTRDRELLLQRCRALEKMKIQSQQYPPVSKGAAFEEDAATLSTCSHMTPPDSPYSTSESLGQVFEEDTTISTKSLDLETSNKELEEYKKKNEDQAKELSELREWKSITQQTVQGLEAQSQNTSYHLATLAEKLTAEALEKEKAIAQREAYKDKLRQLLELYKTLNAQYQAVKSQTQSEA